MSGNKMSWRNRLRWRAREEDDTREADRRTRHQDVLRRIDALTTELMAEQQRQATQDHWKGVRESIWLGAGIAATLIALTTLLVFGRQLGVMRDQVNIAQVQVTEMQAERRAWVGLAETSGAEGMRSEGNGVSLTLRWTLRNGGKDPADIVYVNVATSIGTLVPNGSFARWQSAVCAERPTLPNTFVLPGTFDPTFVAQNGYVPLLILAWL